MKRALDLRFDALTTPERLGLLQTCETLRRQLPAVEHPLLNQLAEQAGPTELGGALPVALANRLLISRADAARRVHEAADLGQRRAFNGEPLQPALPATAEAQRNGDLGAGHLAVIRGFCHRLPDFVDIETRAKAEAQLARLSREHRPDELAKLADTLTDCLHPDGDYTDIDRAKRRGITIGRQDLDGMSADPRAPDPRSPRHPGRRAGQTGRPGHRRHRQHPAQRHHDALLTPRTASGLLASGQLGQHNGLPASIIVTTTLKELEAGAGRGLTAGGTLLPMPDVIRLARQAHHYLAIFDHGKALALYHTKRLASPAQRIMLHAKDRGCTHPGCDVPGYLTEVHHLTPWAQCRDTDINNLTLACGPHHTLTEHGWTTRTRANGNTDWIPPTHLDHGQPRTNTYHHPEKLLQDNDDGEVP